MYHGIFLNTKSWLTFNYVLFSSYCLHICCFQRFSRIYTDWRPSRFYFFSPVKILEVWKRSRSIPSRFLSSLLSAIQYKQLGEWQTAVRCIMAFWAMILLSLWMGANFWGIYCLLHLVAWILAVVNPGNDGIMFSLSTTLHSVTKHTTTIFTSWYLSSTRLVMFIYCTVILQLY